LIAFKKSSGSASLKNDCFQAKRKPIRVSRADKLIKNGLKLFKKYHEAAAAPDKIARIDQAIIPERLAAQEGGEAGLGAGNDGD